MAQKLISALDTDGDGQVSLDEITKALSGDGTDGTDGMDLVLAQRRLRQARQGRRQQAQLIGAGRRSEGVQGSSPPPPRRWRLQRRRLQIDDHVDDLDHVVDQLDHRGHRLARRWPGRRRRSGRSAAKKSYGCKLLTPELRVFVARLGSDRHNGQPRFDHDTRWRPPADPADPCRRRRHPRFASTWPSISPSTATRYNAAADGKTMEGGARRRAPQSI